MESEIQALLAELQRSGKENDSREQERSKKMLNLDPNTASLVALLLQSSRRRNLLEIGTSNGYSTIWLATAMRKTGGRLTSIDRNPEKHRLAEENLAQAGLRDLVELRQGNATEVVAALPGPFDSVFFDADRLSAPEQLSILLPKLTPDALIMADNALSHPDEIAGYLEALDALPEFETAVVPVGKGLSIAYRAGRPL